MSQERASVIALQQLVAEARQRRGDRASAVDPAVPGDRRRPS